MTSAIASSKAASRLDCSMHRMDRVVTYDVCQVLTHSDMSAVTAVAKALGSAMTLLNVFILLVILELVLCVACVIWIVEVVLCPDVSKTFVRRRPVKGILDAFRYR